MEAIAKRPAAGEATRHRTRPRQAGNASPRACLARKIAPLCPSVHRHCEPGRQQRLWFRRGIPVFTADANKLQIQRSAGGAATSVHNLHRAASAARNRAINAKSLNPSPPRIFIPSFSRRVSNSHAVPPFPPPFTRSQRSAEHRASSGIHSTLRLRRSLTPRNDYDGTPSAACTENGILRERVSPGKRVKTIETLSWNE